MKNLEQKFESFIDNNSDNIMKGLKATMIITLTYALLQDAPEHVDDTEVILNILESIETYLKETLISK